MKVGPWGLFGQQEVTEESQNLLPIGLNLIRYKPMTCRNMHNYERLHWLWLSYHKRAWGPPGLPRLFHTEQPFFGLHLSNIYICTERGSCYTEHEGVRQMSLSERAPRT